MTPGEIRAIPTLFALQRARGLLHWIERHRVGLDPYRNHLLQAERLLEIDTWLVQHADDLVDAVGR